MHGLPCCPSPKVLWVTYYYFTPCFTERENRLPLENARPWFIPRFRTHAFTVWLICLQSIGGDLIPQLSQVTLEEMRWDEISSRAFSFRTRCKLFHHSLLSNGQMPRKEWTLNNSLLEGQLITLYGGSRIDWEFFKLGITQIFILTK